jgi:hypothetical protein
LVTDVEEATKRTTNTKQVLRLEVQTRDSEIQLVKLGLFF